MVLDRKSTRLNSSHLVISYAVFCLKKKKKLKFPSTRYRHAASAALSCSLHAVRCRSSRSLNESRQMCDTSRHLTFLFFFFFNDPATTEFSPFSLHDALPI